MGLRGKITVQVETKPGSKTLSKQLRIPTIKRENVLTKIFIHSNILLIKTNTHDIHHSMEMTFE